MNIIDIWTFRVDKFVDFQKRFQEEVIRMEFELYNVKVNPKTGKKFISELSFSETILAYAGFNKAKTKKILKNISKLYGDNSEVEYRIFQIPTFIILFRIKGIYLQDYENFFKVMRSIQEINTALNFYAIAGASIDKDILKHVSKTVAGVVLGDHLVDVIFNLFDVDGKRISIVRFLDLICLNQRRRKAKLQRVSNSDEEAYDARLTKSQRHWIRQFHRSSELLYQREAISCLIIYKMCGIYLDLL